MENHSKVYSGKEIEVLAIKNLLELHEIEYFVRDDIHPGIIAGFGTLDRAIHIFVKNSDFNKALKLIDNMAYDESTN